MKNYRHIKHFTLLLFALGGLFPFQTKANEQPNELETKAIQHFDEHNYSAALPFLEKAHINSPENTSLGFKLGVCLYETRTDLTRAVTLLTEATKHKYVDAYLYLGDTYTELYRINEATKAYDEYLNLKKKDKRDKAAPSIVAQKKEQLTAFQKLTSKTENIQIIDSLIVDKANLLSAYKLSPSGGRLEYFNNVFNSNIEVKSTVYFNEKETKIYFAQPEEGLYSLFTMDKLLNGFGNENHMSVNNFGLTQNLNYIFVMSDGATIYFAAEDASGLGGYDLYVTRYNTVTNTYLSPQRLNMPFNSKYNDYLMVIDEQKGVGWFATDRFMPAGKVCVYTFIPNKEVELVDSDNPLYLANRARISSIKDSWQGGKDYYTLQNLAKKDIKIATKETFDFEFVINDKHTYRSYDDFKNSGAKSIFAKALEKKEELEETELNLNNLRNTFAGLSQIDKANITSQIIQAENKVETLRKEVLEMKKSARNEEIKTLGEQ